MRWKWNWEKHFVGNNRSITLWPCWFWYPSHSELCDDDDDDNDECSAMIRNTFWTKWQLNRLHLKVNSLKKDKLYFVYYVVTLVKLREISPQMSVNITQICILLVFSVDFLLTGIILILPSVYTHHTSSPLRFSLFRFGQKAKRQQRNACMNEQNSQKYR